MQRTCPNCNSPLFETDTVCWHCGQQQSLSLQQSEEITADQATEEEFEPQLDPVSAKIILYYSILLVTTVLALFLISRSLTQSPMLTLNPDKREGDWISLTNPTKLFSIEIPATWHWHFQEGARSSTSFTDLLESDDRITFAVMPLGDLVPDIEYLMVGRNGSSLLVVVRSERLNRLSVEQAAASLQTESFGELIITEARLFSTPAADDAVFVTLTHLVQPLKCIQHLIPTQSKSYLLAACTSTENYSSQKRILQDMLNSFTIRAP